MKTIRSLRVRNMVSTALVAPLLATGAASAQEAAAPVAATPQQPQAAPDAVVEQRVVPMGGVIRPFGSTIRPFGGDLLPNAGNIRTFAGELTGSAGNIRTFAGNIRTFAGEGAPMAGNIRTFAGNIRTFAGNIRTFNTSVNPLSGPDPAFWGTLKPQAGSISAFAGNIRTFSGGFEAYAGNIRTFAGNIRTFAGNIRTFEQGEWTYTGMQGALKSLVDDSRNTWGAAVTQRTGRSFDEAFTAKMLGKYGINLHDPRSLVGLTELGWELFLLDWSDNLYNYSGQDQTDHWMKPVRWSPALTQSMGGGRDTTVGLLDFGVTGDELGSVVKYGGYASSTANTHGSAVASLIVAKHDGRGVMGLAPQASVVNYNPFDSSGTASWKDITDGVRFLLEYKDATGKGVSVLNLSLGVPTSALDSGYNDKVFKDPAIAALSRSRVFVLAAGNDGIVHDANDKVHWNFDQNPSIILVGSVDPNNKISAFSNTPGEASFEKQAGNDPLGTDKLRDRFIVAPGEFVLVSDGQGGVTRMSGTSFAAPLVSGAIALVHDRWPWLAKHPKDTVNIILKSARDLGADGVDPVYGVGMLDVEAALAPLNWNALRFKTSSRGSSLSEKSALTVLNTNLTTRALWDTNSVYFYLFEDTGDSYRDFYVPMSSKLVGKTAGTSEEQFNAYLQGRFNNWMNSRGGCSEDWDCDGVDDGLKGDKEGFATRRFASPIAGFGGVNAIAYATPRAYRAGLRQTGVPFDTALALRSPDGRFGLRFGGGSGAETLGASGFGLRSDYDVETGGANPFLGMASGAGYAAAEVKLAENLSVQVGVSRDDQQIDFDRLSPEQRLVEATAGRYRAAAGTMTMTWRADPRLTATLGYTVLQEDRSLLGSRSLDRTDLPNGTTTDATTLGADYRVDGGLSLSLAGTVGRTRAGDLDRQNIAVAPGGLVSSAWQVGVSKDGVIDGRDRLRLTVAQPLHVEAGDVAFSTLAVVDRSTGELGDIVQTTALNGGRRRFVAEALYGRTIGDGVAEFNVFGRADVRADQQTQPRLTLGGSFRLGF